MTYFDYFEYSEGPRDGKGSWDRHWICERELRRSSDPNRLIIWSVRIESWERREVPEGSPYFRYDS